MTTTRAPGAEPGTASGAAARRGPLLLGVRHHGPGLRARGAGRAGRRPAPRRADRGTARGRRAAGARRRRGRCGRPSRCSPTSWTTRAARRSGRWPSSRRSGSRSGGRWRTACRPASSTCPPPTRWRPSGGPGQTPRRRQRRRRPADGGPGRRRGLRVDPLACSPRPPGTTTRSAGGRTSSSTGPRRSRRRPLRAVRRARRGHGRAARDVRRRRASAGSGPRGPYAAAAARRPQGSSGTTRSPSSAGPGTCPRSPVKSTVAADRALLKGLPKVKAEMTWVPWTHRRLARHSGYGAGIDSPGWYGHLFGAPDRPVERWMTKVAGPAARGGPPRLLRPCHRGGTARRDARRDARPPAARPRARPPTRYGP